MLNSRSAILAVLCGAHLLLSACSSSEATSSGTSSGAGGAGTSTAGTGTAGTGTAGTGGGDSKGFFVKGVSGKDILINRTWHHECAAGDAPGVWLQDERTLTGLVLVTTMSEYNNTSTAPDCTTGRVNVTSFSQTLANDNLQVPFTWADATGAPAAAPAGLEALKETNAVSGLMTAASRTPDTQAGADELNAAKFCGITTWKVGVATDLVDCFTGGVNPAKGTLLVDDRAMPWKIYDGVGGDGTMYPPLMPAVGPHEGPFDK